MNSLRTRAGSVVVAGALSLGVLPLSAAVGAVDDPWHIAEAEARLPLTIAAPGLTGTVENFPVQVTLGGDVTGAVEPNDLVFTTAGDPTPLPYEVESWEPGGEATMWVRTPVVSASVETLYVYYDVALENSTNPHDVWDSSFEVVTHMAEDTGEFADSTGKGHILNFIPASDGAAPTYGHPGIGGSPSVLLNTQNQYLQYPGGPDTVGNAVENITVSTTVYLTETHLTSAENHMVSRDYPSLNPDTDHFASFVHNGRYRPRLHVITADGSVNWTDTTYTTLTQGPGWYNFTFTYDGTSVTVYVNGQQTAQTAAPGALPQGIENALNLGAISGLAYPAKAGQAFDEFRLSGVARSADWVRAEYLSSTGELVTVGAPEGKDGATALTLLLTSPTAGEQTGPQVTLAGSLNQAATLSYTLDGGIPVDLGVQPRDFSVEIPELSDGSHTIDVTATAEGLEPVTQTVTFDADAAGPEITVNSPTEGGDYPSGGVLIDVRAQDSAGSTLSLTVDGVPVRNGNRYIPETDGEHTLLVTAVDSYGNTSEKSVVFTAAGLSDEREPWAVENAQHRLPIVLNGDGMAESVTNFPVLVRLDASEIDHTQADPAALVFTAAGSTDPLPYEVENWNPDGVSSVWVQVPELAPGASEIYLYYGGTPLNTLDPTTVWDDGFDVVTHMDAQLPEGFEDSTGNGYWLTPVSGTVPVTRDDTVSNTPGVSFGAGQALDYVNNGGPGLGSPHMALTTAVYLAESHVAASSVENYIAAREISGFPADDQFTYLLHQGSIGPRLAVDGQWKVDTRTRISAGWHILSFSYDGQNVTEYVDGIRVNQWAAPGSLRDTSVYNIRLGAMPSGAYPAKDGYVYDEFRLSTVPRSESWMRAEYLSLTGQLAGIGAAEQSTESDALVVSVTSPADGSVVARDVSVTGTVSKTAQISYSVDGGAPIDLGVRLGAFTIDVGELSGGAHSVEVFATAGDEAQTATVTFEVDDVLPSITMISPVADANYGTDGVDVNVTAEDNGGIASLLLTLDGKPVENGTHLGSEDLVGDFHTLVARAVDNAGNVTEEIVSFTAVGTMAPDSWLVPEANRRVPFVIQAPVTGTVQDFPVLIQFDDRIVDYSVIDPDHMVFTTADDPTPLDYDVERWFSSARLSSVWVNVPSITSDAQTIYMYFDGVEPTTTDPTAVWDEDFDLVSHLEYEASPQRDVTGNGNEIPQLGQQGYRASGGNETPAVQFDNTPGLHVDRGAEGPGVTAENITVMTTVSIPASMLDPDDNTKHVLVGRGTPFGDTNADQFSLYVQNGSVHFAIRASTTTWSVASSQVLEAGWYTIHGTHDGSLTNVYVDGAREASVRNGYPVSTTSREPFMLGSLRDGSMDAVGMIMDEIRVSTITRTADWIRAEAMAADTSLVQAGGMETSDGAPALFLESPAPGETYGPGLLSVSGGTWEPLEVSYVIDGGEPVELGTVNGVFGEAVSGLENGEHTIQLTGVRPSGRVATRTATFFIDAAGPTVEFVNPTEGAHFEQNFTVEVNATDELGVTAIELFLDGEPIQNGQEVDLTQVTGFEHVLEARATDSVGNETIESITFSAPGALPAVPHSPIPADGTTGVDPSAAALSVIADDAATDPLDVRFHWTYVGGAEAAYEGTSRNAAPGVADGTAVDVASVESVDDVTLTSGAERAYPFQRFEVPVPSEVGSDEFIVEWSGTVPQGNHAEMSVWNHASGSWELVASGWGPDLTLDAVVPVADHVQNDVAQVLVQNVPPAVLDDDGRLRFIWITDTQRYSAGDHEQTYHDMTQWVIDNREAEDISYGVHTGDIVDNGNIESQWVVADRAHQTWDDANFPYGIVPGNHDVTGGSYSNYEDYRQWFGASRFAHNAWYGGQQRDNADHYDIISTPDADYLVLYLGLGLTPAIYQWANDVINAHPDFNVIIALHIYLLPYGGADYEYQGREVFNKLVAPNENVDMVLTGHNCSPVTRVQHPSEGRTVYEVMYDSQCNPNGGDGWMRYVDFDADARTMTQSTFSIKKEGNQYWPEGQPYSAGSLDLTVHENGTYDYDLTWAVRSISTNAITVSALGAESIGNEVVTVSPGERATLDLPELDANAPYSWYASVTNSRGHTTISPVWSFTTGESQREPVIIEDVTAPEFIDESGTENDVIVIPDVEGVTWLLDGVDVAAGTHLPVGAHTVTAQPLDGYVIADGVTTEWSYEFSSDVDPVTVETVAEPVFSDGVGVESDTYTIPQSEGVEYLVNGEIVAPGTYPATGTVTITAQPAEGYVLADGAAAEWSQVFTGRACFEFADVPSGMLFHDEIVWMGCEGISTGWPEADGSQTYRPLEATNRDAMAAFMFRLASNLDPEVASYEAPAVSPFADIATDNLFYREIAWMHDAGISTGWDMGDGTFEYRPLQPTNRDAMAAFMFRLGKLLDPKEGAYIAPRTSAFVDVARDNLFYREISWMYQTGISTGWDTVDGRLYGPLKPTNRDAMAAFMSRLDEHLSQ